MTNLLDPVGLRGTVAVLRPSDLDGGWNDYKDKDFHRTHRYPERWDEGRLRHMIAAVGTRPVILEVQSGLAFVGHLTGRIGTVPGYSTPTLGFWSHSKDDPTYYRAPDLGIVTVLDDGRDGPHFRPKWDMIRTFQEERSHALQWVAKNGPEMPAHEPWQYGAVSTYTHRYGVTVTRYRDIRESNQEPQTLRRFDSVEVRLEDLAAWEAATTAAAGEAAEPATGE